LNALRKPLRESLQLSWLQEGERNLQVLLFPKTPDVKRDHLSFKQGMETATSVAPL
jgi:aromatic ring-cleaving dioxygenase